MTVTETHHRQIGEDFLGSSFQRRGEALRKQRLLTFKKEYKGGQARVTTSEE